ncbi:hypothetical protein ACSBR1_001218 [Camellia fascicularis]
MAKGALSCRWRTHGGFDHLLCWISSSTKVLNSKRRAEAYYEGSSNRIGGVDHKKMMKHSWVESDLNCEDTEYLLGERSRGYELGGCTTSRINIASPTRYDSVREHIRLPFDGGR